MALKKAEVHIIGEKKDRKKSRFFLTLMNTKSQTPKSISGSSPLVLNNPSNSMLDQKCHSLKLNSSLTPMHLQHQSQRKRMFASSLKRSWGQ